MARSGIIALVLCLAAPLARAESVAHAAGSFTPRGQSFRSSTGEVAIDLFADFATLAAEIALFDNAASSVPLLDDSLAINDDPMRLDDSSSSARARARRGSGEPYQQENPPAAWRNQRRARRLDARQGFLFSFGLGGAGLHVSPHQGTGAIDFDLRMGYGFSDRFQLFGDLAVDSGQYGDGTNVSSWTLMARGQTVLIGDRDGNGLNVNAGVGLGGITLSSCGGYCDYYNYGYQQSSAIGLAAGAGLSYDARLGQSFRLSPEFFFSWHQVPNANNGLAADIATAVGFRLNFLWYVQ